MVYGAKANRVTGRAARCLGILIRALVYFFRKFRLPSPAEPCDYRIDYIFVTLKKTHTPQPRKFNFTPLPQQKKIEKVVCAICSQTKHFY